MRDCAKIIDQFGMGHADAGVRDREKLLILFGFNRNLQRQIRLDGGLAGSLQKTKLFEGIRAIGNEFADKNFLIGVQRMNDDVQQLLNLCLKRMFLRCAHKREIGNGDQTIFQAPSKRIESA